MNITVRRYANLADVQVSNGYGSLEEEVLDESDREKLAVELASAIDALLDIPEGHITGHVVKRIKGEIE